MVRRPTFESLEWRRLLASDWQNAARVRDVDNDRVVTPLDALLGINRLNQHAGPLPARAADSTEPYYDVNGDGFATAIDVLLVVNSLNGGLLIDAALAKDTGLGPDAARDGLTSDASVRGHVQGQPDFLQMRVSANSPWQDVPNDPDANGVFSITSAALDSLFGGPLSDGDYTLQLRAGHIADSIELADQTEVVWQLDRTPPTSRFIGDILVTDPNRIVIPLSEPVLNQSIDSSAVNLYDVSWGENAVGSPWGVDGIHPRFLLLPRSITVSANGRELIIEPPAVDRSIKYLVELGPAVQDMAGNKFDVDGSAQTLVARANYFAPTEQLQLDTSYSYKSEPAPKVIEYTIRLDRDDILIWSGDRSVANNSRYELYDADGTLLHVLSASTISGPGTAAAPAFWPVTAGEYHLRKIDPPLASGLFRIYRASQLPELPANHIVTESDNWPLDFYKADLAAGDNVYLESLSFIRAVNTVFNPLGERMAMNATQANNQVLHAELTGTYIFGAWRIDFNSYRSSSGNDAPVTTGSVDGQLIVPGQRQQITFVTVPGEVYALDAKDSDADIEFTVEATKIDSLEWVFNASQTSITVSVQKTSADSAPRAYHLRLKKLTDAQPLPLNTLLQPSPIGTANYYICSNSQSGDRLLLDGDNDFALIFVDQAGTLNVQPGHGPLALSNLSNNFLVRVKASKSALPWIARTVEVISRSLEFDKVTALNFTHGFERYELQFTAEQDEILALENIQNQAGQTVEIAVLDSADSPARALNSDWPGSNYQFTQPGSYRVVINGQGAASRGVFNFRATSSDSWPLLPFGVTQKISAGEQQRFKLPAGLERLYLHTLTARSNTAWLVGNQRGEIAKRFDIVEGSSVNDLDLPLPALDQHYLIATTDNNSSQGPFEYVCLNAVTSVAHPSLGQPVFGQLSGLGDRLIVRYEIARGQRVQFSNLGINPDSVSLQWQNVPGPTSLNQPWLAPATMTYELVLTNRSDVTQPYVLNLALAPAEVLGQGLSGFNIVRSGTVTSAAYSFIPFEVEAGAMFMLDWQLVDASVEIAIVSPSGDVLQTVYNSDTSLIKAETSGLYLVRLLAHFEETQAYRFVLRDLATAPTVALGQTIDEKLAPLESRLLQLPLSTATDLLPLEDSQTGVRVQWISSLRGGQTGDTFAAGTVALLLVNETSNLAPVNFVVRSSSSLATLELDVPLGVQLNPGMTYSFRFMTDQPNLDVGWRLSVPGATVQLLDGFGDIQRAADGLYHLPYAGEYRLNIFMPSIGESQFAQLLLAKALISSVDYPPGSTVSDSLPVAGFERRYTFTLPSDGPVLFGFSGISALDVRLTTASGRLINLNTTSDWRFPSIQYLASGSYAISVIAPTDQFNYSLFLQPLSTASLIQPDDYAGQLSDQELIRVYRYESVQSEQLFWTNLGDQPQYVQLFSTAGAIASFDHALTVDPAHPLFVVVQGTSTAYHFSLIKPFRTEYDLTSGTTFEKVVSSPAETQIASFMLTEPNLAIEFASGDATAVLIKPDGSKLPFTRSQPNLFTGLAPGQYKIEISTQIRAAAYSLKATELNAVPAIVIGNSTEVISDSYYKLDIPAADLLRTRLTDGANRAISLSSLNLWNDAGQPLFLSGQTGFDQGGYWLKFTAPKDTQGPYRLLLTSSRSEVIVASLDQHISVALDQQVDGRRVRIPVSAGSLIALADSMVAEETFARYRFVPLTGSFADDSPWHAFSDFPSVLPIDQTGTIELDYAGFGLSTVRLVNLRQAPLLVLGQEDSVTITSSTRLLAWRMPTDPNWSLQFTRIESDAAAATWYMVDGQGTLHPLPPLHEVLSSVSSAPLFLIATINNPLPSTVRVRLDAWQ